MFIKLTQLLRNRQGGKDTFGPGEQRWYNTERMIEIRPYIQASKPVGSVIVFAVHEGNDAQEFVETPEQIIAMIQPVFIPVPAQVAKAMSAPTLVKP